MTNSISSAVATIARVMARLPPAHFERVLEEDGTCGIGIFDDGRKLGSLAGGMTPEAADAICELLNAASVLKRDSAAVVGV